MSSSVTRQSLRKCKTKGCPFTPDEHEEWMALCRQAPEHGHRDDQLSHQHHPKKGMGGHNQKSKIVAILCWPMHDRIDNGDWSNDIKDFPGRGLAYFAWDLHGNILIERPVLSAAAEGELKPAKATVTGLPTGSHGADTGGSSEQVRGPSAAAPSAGVLSDGAEGEQVSKEAVIGPSAPPLSKEEDDEGLHGGADYGASTGPSNRGGSPIVRLTHEQRVAIAQEIKDAQLQRQWRAGDTANQWEEELGEDFWNLYANEFGYTYPSLRNVMRVCERIPPERRNPKASFALHNVMAPFDFETQEAWLERAHEEEWTVKRLREELVAEGLLETKPKTKRWALSELLEGVEEWPHPTDRPRPKGAVRAYLTWLGER